MEHRENDSAGVTADRLALNALIEAALDDGRDPRPGRAQRADGWTPERIRSFLEAMARGLSVTAAAAEAGMTARTAYRLYGRADAFRLAWDAALQSARPPAAGPFRSRVLHGYVEPIIRHGKVWGERHRFDNRHTMAVLTGSTAASPRTGRTGSKPASSPRTSRNSSTSSARATPKPPTISSKHAAKAEARGNHDLRNSYPTGEASMATVNFATFRAYRPTGNCPLSPGGRGLG